MRVIFVPVADRPECARALNTAFDLGHRLGASVKGCHIRPHRRSSMDLSSEFATAAWRKKGTKSAPAAARALYKRMVEQHGYELIRRPRVKSGRIVVGTGGLTRQDHGYCRPRLGPDRRVTSDAPELLWRPCF